MESAQQLDQYLPTENAAPKAALVFNVYDSPVGSSK
jgi:hypothetical protein